MKYLFLAYADEDMWDSLSEAERAAFERACLANDALIRESGHLLAAENLRNSHTSTIVRARDGAVSLIEGSLVESKEQLIGLFFIVARDLNEAIHVASQMPQARGGPIEVRPMMVFDRL